MEEVVIRGISLDRNQAKLTVDVSRTAGVAGRIFSTVAAQHYHRRHDRAKRLRARERPTFRSLSMKTILRPREQF